MNDVHRLWDYVMISHDNDKYDAGHTITYQAICSSNDEKRLKKL